VDGDILMSRSRYSFWVNSAMNCGPRLEMTLPGRLCSFQMFQRKSSAAPWAVTVV
jgi:hypothetical protein